MTTKYHSSAEALGVLMSKMFMLGVIILCGLLTTYYAGFVLRTIWGNFLTPAGYDAITQKTAIGIMLVTNILILGLATLVATRTEKTDDETPQITRGVMRMGTYAMTLTITWGVASFWAWYL